MSVCVRLLLLAGLLAGSALPVAAETKLPSLISDHMVLQREEPVPIWGWDNPGTEVTVTLGDKQAKATAGDDGKWTAELPALKAGGPHELKISGSSDITVKDVLVGEVWLCSGQSNMEWTVNRSANFPEEQKAANHPRIRHIKFPHRPSDKPEADIPSQGGWQSATPDTVGGFTAVGYFFAVNLQSELDNVPIGLLGCNWGGTRIEPWTPPVGFKQVPELSSITDKLSEFPAKTDKGINHQSPLALYNGMISPLVPYGIRGALWYQGESNNGEGMDYYHKMRALIAGWRELWDKPELPFLYVQLAPYNYRNRAPEALAGIWEAQLKALSIPNTGMAVTVDIGNTGDIHPKNKQDVGKRLALWALATVYGKQDLVYSGPLFKSAEVKGNQIRVTFDHVGGGLKSRDGKPLSHFQIAGKDRKFVDAQAKIDGDSVVVSADSVQEPVAVRYAYTQEAEPNLSNAEGLPASPFRTDEF